MRQLKPGDREALRKWEQFYEDGRRDTAVQHKSRAEMEKHRKYLEAHPIEWIQFFFEKAAKYEFAPFQIQAIMRCINNSEWFEVLSWARSLAKSTITMLIIMYLILAKKSRKCIILLSATEDSAARLLRPYMIALEKNSRIKAYYGDQVGGKWTDNEFITSGGVSFWGIGYGNAPRGARNEEIRPDTLLIDDYDTDKSVRNEKIVEEMWQFFETAVMGTRDPAVDLLIIASGNIIAKMCCITKAGSMANSWSIVNIRDKNGRSSWPQKNTEEMIDRLKGSAAAIQREYYNNPVIEGEIFATLTDGKIPSLKSFRYLVVYGDPAPGENKGKKGTSTKAVWLCGKKDGKLYVIYGFLDQGLNDAFIEWYFRCNEYAKEHKAQSVYNYMENNKLQDPFFQQLFKPLVTKKRKEKNEELYIKGDEEKKTDKATRIEANLEPLDREGNIIFNIEEKDNPNMIRLKDQFKLFDMQLSYAADGPDCIEGANRMLNNKAKEMQPTTIIPRSVTRRGNKYRI